jgi:hypothetical protein
MPTSLDQHSATPLSVAHAWTAALSLWRRAATPYSAEAPEIAWPAVRSPPQMHRRRVDGPAAPLETVCADAAAARPSYEHRHRSQEWCLQAFGSEAHVPLKIRVSYASSPTRAPPPWADLPATCPRTGTALAPRAVAIHVTEPRRISEPRESCTSSWAQLPYMQTQRIAVHLPSDRSHRISIVHAA